jgi:hypothetical protein
MDNALYVFLNVKYVILLINAWSVMMINILKLIILVLKNVVIIILNYYSTISRAANNASIIVSNVS